MDGESLADRLKIFRTNKQISQKDMADTLALDNATYNKIENGTRALKVSDLSFLYYMGCSIDWLITGKGKMNIGYENLENKEIIEIANKQASALETSANALSDLAEAAKETAKVLNRQYDRLQELNDNKKNNGIKKENKL